VTFIAFEGGEGAGKSTQVARLASWLEGLGTPFVVAREPGGTGVGEAVRSVVLDRPDLDVSPESELLLILAARAAFVQEVVRPALARGAVVVADRFDLSTLAYQGYGRGLDIETVRRLNAFATGGLRPDAYVLLDVTAEEGRARQAREGKAADRMEREGGDFRERVRRAYRELASTEPGVHVIDGGGMPDAVEQAVRRALHAALPETFPDPDHYTEVDRHE
jgi:dTMP kinase